MNYLLEINLKKIRTQAEAEREKYEDQSLPDGFGHHSMWHAGAVQALDDIIDAIDTILERETGEGRIDPLKPIFEPLDRLKQFKPTKSDLEKDEYLQGVWDMLHGDDDNCGYGNRILDLFTEKEEDDETK